MGELDLDLDLYGDLNCVEEDRTPQLLASPPIPPWRSKPVNSGPSVAPVERSPPSTSGVEALLELLRADAEDFLDEDEADEAFGIEKVPPSEPREVDGDLAPSKRRRLEAESTGPSSAPGADDMEGFDFEFEADLQKVDTASQVQKNRQAGLLSEDARDTQLVVPEVPNETALQPASAVESMPTTTSKYVYNGRMKRWEMRTLKASSRPPVKDAAARPSGAQPRRKVKFCRFFAIHGNCKFSDRCYYAHSEAELDLGDDVEAQQRIISECAYKAWEDSEAPGGCSYAQALAVRLAIRFEAQPQNLLPTMEKSGLPMSGGSRATVKMLLRLCHPDKCSHPEAKRAVQILGPVLQSTS